MIPIYGERRGRQSTAYVVILLILANAAIFLYQQTLASPLEQFQFIYEWGAIPAEISQFNELETLVTSMFLHGSWAHLGGNMLFLWVFGANVENAMGHIGFVFFYLLTGVIGAIAQVVFMLDSLVPMVGASGAISGILGAYILLIPRGRIVTLVILGFFITTFLVPARLMIGVWILLQVVMGLATIDAGLAGDEGGVAYMAHIGGFVGGLVLVWVFRDPGREAQQRREREQDEWRRRREEEERSMRELQDPWDRG